jgi:uncharacterized membrane protein
MRKKFWTGFTAGAVAGAGAAGASLLAWRAFGRVKNGRILRLEKSIQIGRPVNEVFAAWSRLEDLPNRTGLVQEVRTEGDHSRWILNLGGRLVRWEAEVTQRIQNEALGWKSVGGPKHTGRIDFSPLGNDTLVHITMNYAPPGQMGNLFSPLWGRLEHYIEQALRDFKASLEGKGQEGRIAEPSSERMPMGSITPTPAMNQQRATGTYGTTVQAGADVQSRLDQHTQTTRFGGAPETTVEYTAPPEAKR